jgi:DNA-binding MarR family transcriptional regulator
MNTFQKLFNCDASNITGIIDGLEEKNLVTRGEKADDRRVKIVLLTSDGAKVQEQITRDLIKADDSMLHELTSVELVQFRNIMEKISKVA